jgi:hypothetical protein
MELLALSAQGPPRDPRAADKRRPWQAVLPETILKPEVQDPKIFAEGVETIVSTNRRVAQAYIDDGRSVEALVPLSKRAPCASFVGRVSNPTHCVRAARIWPAPLSRLCCTSWPRAGVGYLSSCLCHPVHEAKLFPDCASYEGLTISDPKFRAMWSRDAVVSSAWCARFRFPCHPKTRQLTRRRVTGTRSASPPSGTARASAFRAPSPPWRSVAHASPESWT